MEQTLLSSLTLWANFYVIVGSSSAALIGLQFVVVVLSAQASGPGGAATVSAFGTPTIVHLSAALLISAVMSAPWSGISTTALAVGLPGAAGLLYQVYVMSHALRQTGYRPVLEDWIWHGLLPLLAYGALPVVAFFLPSAPGNSLFAVGGSALLLLFIGIHNAWDSAVYIALQQRNDRQANGGRGPGE